MLSLRTKLSEIFVHAERPAFQILIIMLTDMQPLVGRDRNRASPGECELVEHPSLTAGYTAGYELGLA